MRAEALAGVARAGRKRPVIEPGPRTHPVRLGRSAIERILPHREPFLLVDEITAVDLEQRGIWARRRVAPDDPVFAGHFPGHPVYPGVLQVELLGQAGLCGLYFCNNATLEVVPDLPMLDARALQVHDAVFIAEVGPGDELTVLAKILDQDAYTATLVGQVFRGQQVCSLATVEAYLVGEHA